MRANILNNRFFEVALQKASHILGKPGRLVLLLVAMGRKIKQTNFTNKKIYPLILLNINSIGT